MSENRRRSIAYSDDPAWEQMTIEATGDIARAIAVEIWDRTESLHYSAELAEAELHHVTATEATRRRELSELIRLTEHEAVDVRDQAVAVGSAFAQTLADGLTSNEDWCQAIMEVLRLSSPTEAECAEYRRRTFAAYEAIRQRRESTWAHHGCSSAP
jgi:hypothetical protein